MFGTFAVPCHLLATMPFIMFHGTRGTHDGQGLSNPPDLTCQAFDFVISSSGLVEVVEGAETVAA